jgi:hypothetical protein
LPLNAAERRRGGAVSTIGAADFINGGLPSFARAFDRHGQEILELSAAERDVWYRRSMTSV